MIKKITLFGATGQTGNAFLNQILNSSYEITALVRNASKLKISAPILKVIEGDVLNITDVEKAVAGADIVVSLFGRVKDSPDLLQTNGIKNIIAAMQKFNVQRIISLSGGALPFPEKDQPKFVDKIFTTIMNLVAKKMLDDAKAHYEVLKNSNVKWMVVRGPRLTNEPKKGTYKIGWVGVNASTKISREDLATFIVTQIEDESFNYQMPFVSN
jgi:putative NADH-flavin reductase